MKKLIPVIALCTLAWASCDMGGTSDKREYAPEMADTLRFTTIQWKDTVVNFGTITQGEKIKVRFQLKNTGKQPLYLVSVKAGCGCTVPDYTKGAIPPGGEGEVTGEFDSNKAHAGEVRKNIFVTTNTHGKTGHTLIFAGQVNEKK